MNWAELVPQAIAIFAAVGGAAGLTQLFKIGIERRKERAVAGQAEAQAGKFVTDTAVGLLEPLREQIAYLGSELHAARGENIAAREESKAARAESEKLRDEVQQLRQALAELVLLLAEVPGTTVPARLAALAQVRDLPDPQRRRRPRS